MQQVPGHFFCRPVDVNSQAPAPIDAEEEMILVLLRNVPNPDCQLTWNGWGGGRGCRRGGGGAGRGPIPHCQNADQCKSLRRNPVRRSQARTPGEQSPNRSGGSVRHRCRSSGLHCLHLNPAVCTRVLHATGTHWRSPGPPSATTLTDVGPSYHSMQWPVLVMPNASPGVMPGVH